MLPDNISTAFIHAHKRVGGHGIDLLRNEADIWTITKAIRLMYSNDITIANTFFDQLCDILVKIDPNPSLELMSKYLSGSMHGPLIKLAHLPNTRPSLWTRARLACSRLNVRIVLEISTCQVLKESINCSPVSMVSGLRIACRDVFTKAFCAQTSHGASAACLNEESPNKDIVALLSSKTELSSDDYKLWLKSHLRNIPCRANPQLPNKSTKLCRKCNSSNETTDHILNSIVCREFGQLSGQTQYHCRSPCRRYLEKLIAGSG